MNGLEKQNVFTPSGEPIRSLSMTLIRLNMYQMYNLSFLDTFGSNHPVFANVFEKT